MRKLFFLLTLLATALLAVQAIAQQAPASSNPPAQSSSQPASSDQSHDDVASPDAQAPDSATRPQDKAADQQDSDKPSRGQRMKKHMKDQMSSWCVGAPLNHCYERKSGDDADKDGQAQSPRAPRSDDTASAPPVAPGESSSKDTKVDLSPPVGDEAEHPDSGTVDSDVNEFHPWDPHRAMKNIEVGDYYYKQKNYRAAASRYEEALQWKPRDAEATYKLADAQEKLGEKEQARKHYQAYLSILPEGPHAPEANKALARLK